MSMNNSGAIQDHAPSPEMRSSSVQRRPRVASAEELGLPSLSAWLLFENGQSTEEVLIPGVLLFRMAGGLVELLTLGDKASFDVLRNTVADGASATRVILAMAFGLIVPEMCIEYICPGLVGIPAPGARGRTR